MEEIDCDIRQGTQEDAQWYSYSANQGHGLRRTTEDKQRAVKAALVHPKGAGMSDSDIARHVGVDHKTVAAQRKAILGISQDMKTRTATRKGKTYKIDITKIGLRGPVTANCTFVRAR
ncbi:MAG: hypothetical protein Q8N47_27125, partial [Bryobacterales bacterium]|nr:hypothetical protein [Bryobacterales bacterium]